MHIMNKILNVDDRKRISKYFEDYRDKFQPGAVNKRRYPHGYSGKIGIWKSYFNDKNIKAYNNVIDSYAKSNKEFGKLLEYYPDLKL